MLVTWKDADCESPPPFGQHGITCSKRRYPRGYLSSVLVLVEVEHSAAFSIYVTHNMSFDQRNSPTFTLLYQTEKNGEP
jgi:hypothetical protein